MRSYLLALMWMFHSGESAFVDRLPLRPLKPFSTKKHASHRGSMTMYFDDVSRNPKHTIQWHPKDMYHMGMSPKAAEIEKNASNEKLEAVKRLLLGYDSESASRLSNEEVAEQMELWMEKSGVVGDALGDELYESLLRMKICRSTSLVGCLAQFWESVVDVIHEYSDEFSPVQRWTVTKSERPKVAMIVFPDCPVLYDSYKNMVTFTTAVEFTKDMCVHLGQRFSLTLFHPKYKNSPKMWSPARHSPFPCSGLHFEGEDDEFISRMLERSRPKRGYVTNDRQGDDSSIPNLKQRRVHLEILFNSAAASSSNDDLSRDPVTRNMSQRFPKELVIDMSKSWIDSNRFIPEGNSQTKRDVNRALQFADTVDGRWTVSSSKIAEEIYAEIWSIISDLYDQGVTVDSEPEPEGEEEEAPAGKKISHIDWMKALGRPFQHKEQVVPSVRVISSMFVSTKFCAFNAQGFKRFAITVNAALRRLTNGQMFLEVFHPEYIGNKGYNSNLRRSPFPTIQVCYEIRKTRPSLKDEVAIENEE